MITAHALDWHLLLFALDLEFNHNVAQMPFYAAVILALWRAVTRGGLHWWAMLGAASAIGVQAKYSFGVLSGRRRPLAGA